MFDIRKFCQAHRIPYLDGAGHHHARRGWVQLHCPQCAGGVSGWHLGFNPAVGAWSCYRCGALRFYNVLGGILGISDRDTIRRIAAKFQTQDRGAVRTPIQRGKTLLMPPHGPLLPAHSAYLQNRGFDPDELARVWGIGGCGPFGGEWAWRVFIPVLDADDRAVSYTARAIADTRPKYRSCEDKLCLIDPQTVVYGLNLVPGDTVCIVEGPTSAWRIGPGAVGTLGMNWHLAQANRLRRFSRRFICYDPEPQAQKRAVELASVLALFPGTTEVLSGFDTDPGEFGPELVAELRKEIEL